MELDHVEEWLLHMQRLGVDVVWIYCERAVVDTRCGQDQPSQTWAKKPEANYNTDMSDSAVSESFRARALNVPKIDVRLRRGESVLDHNGKRQAEHFQQLVLELARSQEVDWLCFVDIDELIVANRPLDRILCDAALEGISVIRMKQRVMDSRWSNGNPIKMASIGTHFGVVPFNTKLFLRPCKALSLMLADKPFQSVHAEPVGAFSGGVRTWPESELCYHHFRGRPTYQSPSFANIERYRQVTETAASDKNFDHVHQFDVWPEKKFVQSAAERMQPRLALGRQLVNLGMKVAKRYRS